MNQAQVAKVTHAALSALSETEGGETAKKYEELNDQERSDLASDAGAYSSGAQKGTSIDVIASSLPGDQKLKAYISHGIANGFHQYEQSVKGSNDLEHHPLDQGASVASKDTVDAQNALARQQAPEPKPESAETVQDAMKQADEGLAGHNS